MEKYYIPWSGGKDSTATIILAQILGIPFEVHTAELLYDVGISANPELHDFKIRAARKLGIDVIWHYPNKTYKDIFLHVKQRGKYIGKINGGLISLRCAMQHLKVDCMQGVDGTPILGIAYDEPQRIKSDTLSLLYLLRYTERDAFELCKEFGLLAPTYFDDTRDGCFFCPNGVKRLSRFAALYPDIYQDYKRLWYDNEDRLTTTSYLWNKHFKHIFELQTLNPLFV